MTSLMFKSLTMKLVKGFIAGGLASVAVVLQQNHYVVQSLTDIQTVLSVLFSAFLTGGILMILKALSWNDSGSSEPQFPASNNLFPNDGAGK